MSDKYITRLCILCRLPVNNIEALVCSQSEHINADLQGFS